MPTSGTLTFLFTDIEQSSRLWDESPEPMRQALTTHNEILIGAIGDNDGTIVKDRGDGFLAVFAGAPDACAAALHAQRGLDGAVWDETIGPLRVRMALHSGTAEARDGDYFGPEGRCWFRRPHARWLRKASLTEPRSVISDFTPFVG
jgi:class 3 adenylate cyclase